MTVPFETIPSNLLVPGVYTETNANRASSEQPVRPRRAVIVGHRLSTGAVAAGTPHRIFSEADADYAHGVGSYLAEACRVFKAANPYCELWAIGLADDGAAVKAEATITCAATSALKGTIVLYISPYWIGPVLRGRYTIAVTADMTAGQIATAIAAAINADPYRVVDATVADTVDVDLEARNGGVNGNAISIAHSLEAGEKLPSGVTLTIGTMASGATNPAISGAISALGAKHTSHLVQPWVDATTLSAVETEMERRWGGTVQLECHAFTAAAGSLGTLTTLGDGRNSPFSTILGVGPSPTPPWIAAADLAAVHAAMNHPGQPLRGRPLNSLFHPVEGSEFDPDEQQQLLAEGISTYTVDSAGRAYVQRVVTTYQEDINGNADSKWRDIMRPQVLFAIRYDWRSYVGGKYPNYMHAADGTAYDPGLPIVTPTTMKNEFEMRARTVWAKGQGWIEDPDQFVRDIYVERTEDGMDLIGVPNLINPLHQVRTRFDFLR